MPIVKLSTGKSANLRIAHVRSERAECDGETVWLEPNTGEIVNWKVKTVARIVGDDGYDLRRAEAKCVGADNFCKRTGVKIAMQRLLKGAGFTKSERSELWTWVQGGRYSPNKETEVENG